MPNLILPSHRRASGLTEAQRDRLESMAPLINCSKDINQWTFTIIGRPDWAPPSCDHALLARDKTTGFEKPLLVDIAQAPDGNFEAEHIRMIEGFTSSLIQLDEILKYLRACKTIGHTPDISQLGHNLEMKVRHDLHRGDHDNDFAS